MPEEFVMRGQTASGGTEVLNFSGYKPGHAYRMTQFVLYPGSGIGSGDSELLGSVTAGKTAVAPTDPDFNQEGLIAVSSHNANNNVAYGPFVDSVINDTFLITQNLLLTVFNTESHAINWQCRFESVKMSGPEEAATNYKQYLISDGS